ncbi:MAG: glycosyltransferase family 1 protein [Solirubrobacteraceae bacterium]|nr:glycosyltransferase family 1 protein [Solirubrobacteraceae bacterium]
MIFVALPQHQVGNRGGIATYTRELTAALEDADEHDIHIQGIGTQAGRQNPLVRLLYEQVRLPTASLGADILHMSDFRVPVRRTCPVIATVHDIGFLTHPHLSRAAAGTYKRAAFRHMIRSTPEMIACDSRYTYDCVRCHAPQLADRCRILPPGIGRVAPRDPVRSDPRYFLTVGSFEGRKNLDMLLRAYRRGRAAGEMMEWIAVGPTDAADRGLLRSLRSTAGVTVPGFVPPEELEQLWARAAFLAMPSQVEGFSYPVVEAMMRGVPVIASCGSALDETAADAALRIPAQDERAWVEAIKRMATDAGERERLSDAGMHHAERFTWETRLPSFLSAYREVHAMGRA